MQMIIPSEAIHETVVELGRQGTVEFQDLNPGKSAFQRTYAGQVKRQCRKKKIVVNDSARLSREGRGGGGGGGANVQN